MPIQTAMQITNRWAIARDLPKMAAIDALCFPDPWSAEDFRLTLHQKNVVGLVMHPLTEYDNPIGYILYELNRAVVTILNLAVHPSHRRQGIAGSVIRKLQTRPRYKPIEAFVHEENLDAQLFFKACGFVAVDVWQHYYEDDGRDAYQFTWED